MTSLISIFEGEHHKEVHLRKKIQNVEVIQIFYHALSSKAAQTVWTHHESRIETAACCRFTQTYNFEIMVNN